MCFIIKMVMPYLLWNGELLKFMFAGDLQWFIKIFLKLSENRVWLIFFNCEDENSLENKFSIK